jgi:hypothetical protein
MSVLTHDETICAVMAAAPAWRLRTNVRLLAGIFSLVTTAVGCAHAQSNGIPTGHYELTAELGGQAYPVQLELLAIDGGPWGRLSIDAGHEIVAAVRGVRAVGENWEFAVGGPFGVMQIEFADSVTGTIQLVNGTSVPLAGRRAGAISSPEDLRSHHTLSSLGLAARAGDLGASFPTGTPDGDIIFTRHGVDLTQQTLMIAKPSAEGWGDPVVFGRDGEYSDRSPAVTPDGSTLIFASNRSRVGDEESERYALWIMRRSGAGSWGQAMLVEFEGGWEHDARQPSITTDGTLYFSSSTPDGHGEGDIYVATHISPGRWGAPRNLGEPINSPGDEHGAYVAPDGSYMTLTSAHQRRGHVGGDDLYLSLPTEGGWSTPAALQLPVNTFGNEYGAWISPYDRYLYFTSDRYGYADIFRVRASEAGVPTVP